MGDRLKDNDWTVPKPASGGYSFEAASLTVLLDLRDELKKLNRVFACSNFLSIPRSLRSINRQIKAQRRCPKHPRYTGARQPTVDCLPCRRFYKAIWK